MDRTDQFIKLQSALKKAGYLDDLAIAKLFLEGNPSDSEFENIIERLQLGEPWQYIHGKVLFRSVNLKVNRDVLIPRIETEIIIDIALDSLRDSIKKDKEKILYIDIGTGSGAIPIALYKEFLILNGHGDEKKVTASLHENNIKFIASDVSKKALKLARENATYNGSNIAIEFIESDLLNSTQLQVRIEDLNDSPTSSLLITANLPYISQTEYEKLYRSVKDWEPKSALVGGKSGDEMIIVLLDQLQTLIKNSKTTVTVILEVDPLQIENICTHAISLGYESEVVYDQFNSERFIILKKTTYPTS